MKNLIISLAVVLSCLQAVANEPYMVREGQQWVYVLTNNVGRGQEYTVDRFTMTFEFEGDTVINGKSYLKLYRTLAHDLRDIDENGDTATIIPAGRQLVASLREDDRHWVYAMYEESYRRQLYQFTLSPATITRLYDPLVDGNFEYPIYHLSDTYANGDENPTWFFRNNFKLNELLLHEVEALTFDTGERISTSEGAPGLFVWRSDRDEMNPIGPNFFSCNFGYYIDTPAGGGAGGTFISPFGVLRHTLKSTSSRLWATGRFSHFIMDGKVVYKGSYYDEQFDTTLQVGVESVEAGVPGNDQLWYNMDGIAFDSRPTQPGVYIHQGKKVVVK